MSLLDLNESHGNHVPEASAFFPDANDSPVGRDIRSRRWVFTWNNASEEEEEAIKGWDLPTFVCFGHEFAPTTRTPHLQGMFIFKNPIKWSTLVARFQGMWIVPMRGTPDQAYDYCTKDDRDVFQRGDLPQPKGSAGGQAMKKDWELAREAAKAGELDRVPANIYVPYYNNLLKIAAKHQAPVEDLDRPCGVWYYGDTGTGKSHAARTEHKDSLYIKNPNKWWDGYDRQDNVLIEDIDKSHEYMGQWLKIWADKYFFPCEIKGSSMVIRPKKIIVTSNYHPKDIWSDVGIIDPILRRFQIVNFRNLGVARVDHSHAGEVVRAAYAPGFNPRPAQLWAVNPLDLEEATDDHYIPDVPSFLDM